MVDSSTLGYASLFFAVGVVVCLLIMGLSDVGWGSVGMWYGTVACGAIAGGLGYTAMVMRRTEVSDRVQTAATLAATLTDSVSDTPADSVQTVTQTPAPADGAKPLDGISSMSAPEFTEPTTGSTEEPIGQVPDGLPVPKIPQ